MAFGIKSGSKTGGAGSVVAWAASGTGKILHISTVGNSATVYIGGSDCSASTGLPLIKDTVYEWPDQENDYDFSSLYLFSAGTDKIKWTYADRG